MKGIITPSKLQGTIVVPPSKSVAHRAVICAALSEGKSIIKNIQLSKDIYATIEGMHALGAEFVLQDDKLEVYGLKMKDEIHFDEINVDCRESGSTLRFLTMIVPALTNREATFIGEGRLGSRPMDCFLNIFDEKGIKYENNSGNKLNLKVQGELKGGVFEIAGNVSSQFISGLLFACPLLKEDSIIKVSAKLMSKGYIDLTLDMLSKFGIEVINKDYHEFIIKGNQVYKARDIEIEGDYSQAAFYVVANAIGNHIEIKGLNPDSLQGDKKIYDYVDQLLKADENDYVEIDGGDCPDIIPILSVLAALRKGKTLISNIARLKIKECDRLSATFNELTVLGAHVIKGDDYLEFDGVDEFKGGVLSTYNDHRMAMTLAIAATRSKGQLQLNNTQCVSKSYPNFWEDYASIGGLIEMED